MIGLFHVALLTGLGATGRDVSMQVASIECGALNGIIKFKNGSQAVALAAHGSLLHKGAPFDLHMLFFRIFFFSLRTIHDVAFRQAMDDAFVLVADHAGNIEFLHGGPVIVQDDRCNLGRHRVSRYLQLRQMAFKTGKILFGSIPGTLHR